MPRCVVGGTTYDTQRRVRNGRRPFCWGIWSAEWGKLESLGEVTRWLDARPVMLQRDRASDRALHVSSYLVACGLAYGGSALILSQDALHTHVFGR